MYLNKTEHVGVLYVGYFILSFNKYFFYPAQSVSTVHPTQNVAIVTWRKKQLIKVLTIEQQVRKIRKEKKERKGR